jgi:Zn-dependent protease with chaperone function
MSEPLSPDHIPLTRVHGETALFIVSLVVSVALWGLLLFFMVKSTTTAALLLTYVLMLALFYFVLRVALITRVRGSGARLGPEQFPELHERVQAIAGRLGMKRVPAAYLMQEGGALNAFAARFIGRSIIVLYSDLMEACGDSAGARDMIIAHELAHVRAGHLRLRWLLLPSFVVPFLGLALSRAREYTCDRVGFAAAGADRDGVLLGLSVLAVGGKFGPRLRHQALAAQRRDLNTGWMTLGQWFSTHPPLAKRMAAFDPQLSPETGSSAGGTLRALSIILGFIVIVVGCGALVALASTSGIQSLLSLAGGSTEERFAQPTDAATQLTGAFAAISTVLDEELAAGNDLPQDNEGLAALWTSVRGDEELPRDPYTGMMLEYYPNGGEYELWSSGPDGEYDTDDDVSFTGPLE